MPARARRGVARRRGGSTARGQSVAEFALILPVMMLLAVGLGDFGRVYASMVAVEAGAREAAGFAAFEPENWSDANRTSTVAELTRRACTAARHLPNYQGAADGSTCTNPDVAWRLTHNAEANPAPQVCADRNLVPPCLVHVTLTYEFETLIRMPPIPESVTIVRESWFAVTELPDPDVSPSPEVTFPLPTAAPVPTPTPTPSPHPTPTEAPSGSPSESPSGSPTESATQPAPTPTSAPTAEPTAAPTAEPTAAPTAEPTADPTPTPEPTPTPAATPTRNPNETPPA